MTKGVQVGRLTTHVLDTAHGEPASGVAIELYRLADEQHERLVATRANADGRVDGPLLGGDELIAGSYELRFHCSDYFRGRGVDLPDPPFLDVVVVRVGIADPAAHYHVPLLVSPFGYTTYRGS